MALQLAEIKYNNDDLDIRWVGPKWWRDRAILDHGVLWNRSGEVRLIPSTVIINTLMALTDYERSRNVEVPKRACCIAWEQTKEYNAT